MLCPDHPKIWVGCPGSQEVLKIPGDGSLTGRTLGSKRDCVPMAKPSALYPLALSHVLSNLCKTLFEEKGLHSPLLL